MAAALTLPAIVSPSAGAMRAGTAVSTPRVGLASVSTPRARPPT